MINPGAILADSAWFPHRYDEQRQVVQFIRLDREAHRGATFLTDEYLGEVERTLVPVSSLREFVPPPNPVHFLFHSAFCCSTLLASALDVPGRVLGLKEPQIINDLAGAALRGKLDNALLGQVLGLLARLESVVVVKPGNEANVLMASSLAVRPNARALLMSSGLEDFLFSVAKKGMFGRIWARRQHSLLSARQSRNPGFSPVEVFQQTDLQIAGMVWLMQRAEFVDFIAAQPARVRSLDAVDLLADARLGFERVADWFDLGLTSADIDGVMASGRFETHAKELGRSYDALARERERAHQQSAYAEEVGMVANWISAVASHIDVQPALVRPVGEILA
jgi:hypothetical protein